MQGLRCTCASGVQTTAQKVDIQRAFWVWRAYVRGVRLLARYKARLGDEQAKVEQQSIALRTQRTALLSCLAAQSERNRKILRVLRIISGCVLILFAEPELFSSYYLQLQCIMMHIISFTYCPGSHR
jgi:hypothetical protein